MTRPRSGYTLIEMIIAMVLVSALMSSVWGIMSLYNSLLTAGRNRTTQQQLVRSVFQIIEEDLGGVSRQPPDPGIASGPSAVDAFPDLSTELPSPADLIAASTTGQPAAQHPAQLSLTGNATALRQ